MANGIKAVKSEEMGIKKTSKVFEMSGSTLTDKVKSKETVMVELGRKHVSPCSLDGRTGQLLSDGGVDIFGTNNRQYYKNDL